MALSKANKGEWSEVYAAMRLIGDGRIKLADSKGDPTLDQWMDVVEVIRKETKDRIVTYGLDPSSSDVCVDVNGDEVINLPASDFLDTADLLMGEIVNGKRAFTASEEVLGFLNIAEVLSSKAASGDKNDIYLTTLDKKTGLERDRIGFSIKSYFGSNPTLFNTAPASGIVYRLPDANESTMKTINAIVDKHGHVATQQRCEKILSLGITPEFCDYVVAKRAQTRAFKENLELLNPLLPGAIEWILYDHFFNGCREVALPSVIKRLAAANPAGITRPEVKYSYMFKAFLYASYCKMTASTLWDGVGVVNGGFISVSEKGEVTCHYALESEEFKSFLYDSAYLDFPDTGPKHGDYASVYEVNGQYYFNLNFQIRLN